MRSRISSAWKRAIVLHELGVAQAGQRPDAGDDRNAELLDALKKVLQQAQVEDRLGDGVLRAGLDFVLESAQFVLNVRHAWIGADTDVKLVLAPMALAPMSRP